MITAKELVNLMKSNEDMDDLADRLMDTAASVKDYADMVDEELRGKMMAVAEQMELLSTDLRDFAFSDDTGSDDDGEPASDEPSDEPSDDSGDDEQ